MNRTEKLLNYAREKPQAEHEHKEAWQADVLTVGGKIFALIGSYRAGRPIVSLKANPEKALILREAYEGVIVPGYYSDKNTGTRYSSMPNSRSPCFSAWSTTRTRWSTPGFRRRPARCFPKMPDVLHVLRF